MSRAYTPDEAREKLLEHIHALVDYWSRTPLKPDEYSGTELQARLDGLAFSILVGLDGGSELPSFLLIPDPHPDDKQFHIDEDENYYPGASLENALGVLHEFFYKKPETT